MSDGKTVSTEWRGRRREGNRQHKGRCAVRGSVMYGEEGVGGDLDREHAKGGGREHGERSGFGGEGRSVTRGKCRLKLTNG